MRMIYSPFAASEMVGGLSVPAAPSSCGEDRTRADRANNPRAAAASIGTTCCTAAALFHIGKRGGLNHACVVHSQSVRQPR